MIDRERGMMIAAGYLSEFLDGNDDPEDTIFLQITHKEACLIGYSVMMRELGIDGPLVFDSAQSLIAKIGDAILAQKIPS